MTDLPARGALTASIRTVQAFGIADLARDVMGQARPGEEGLTEYPHPEASQEDVEVRSRSTLACPSQRTACSVFV